MPHVLQQYQPCVYKPPAPFQLHLCTLKHTILCILVPAPQDSAMFRKWARKAFDEIDMDKTGMVDYKEVCIGLLKIYDQLNAKMPAHVLAPKR